VYFSVPHAAAYLGYSVATVKRLIAQGRLRAYRATPTAHPRVRRSEVEALMAQPVEPASPAVDLDTIMASIDAKYGLRHRRHHLH